MSRSRDVAGLRARLATRLEQGDGESGFVLPFVLLATLLILIGTATALGVVANNAGPALRSQQQETALAAARGGVQAYVAQLNASCTSFSVQECGYPLNTATSTARVLTSASAGAPTLTGADYSVKALNPQGFLSGNNDDLRLLSKGCVPNCTTPSATTTLLADVSGLPSVLRFTYFTNYESVDGTLLANTVYPARTVALNGRFATLVGATSTLAQVGGGSVSWLAPTNGATCNQTWQGGRGTGSNDTVSQAALSAPAGVTASLSVPCSVTFSSGMNFTGPVYSGDQLNLSNGLPGNTYGPSFSVPIACTAGVTTNCEPLPPASSASTPAYRSAAAPLGGSPKVANSVQTLPVGLSLPQTASDAVASCTFVGSNVVIAFSGTTATVSGASTVTGTGCASPVTVAGRTLVVQGNASVSGTLSAAGGQTSVVAQPDASNAGGNIVITGDLVTTGTTSTNQFSEQALASGSAIALVATNDVVLSHNVTCASALPTGTTTGFCPNDITGLYSTDQANEVVDPNTGKLLPTHPARQYCNTAGDTTCGSSADSSCDTSSATTRTVDAAIFALNGSFRTDHYNQGCALGVLKVVGGVYQNHRGLLGQEWETPSSGAANLVRAFSGYRLTLTYQSLQYAGLPYVPSLRGGTPNHPWLVVSISSGTGS